MTNVELLLVYSSFQDCLTVQTWLKVNRMICIGWKYLKSFGCEKKKAQACWKISLAVCLQIICIRLQIACITI